MSVNSDTGTPGRDSQTKTEERDKGREKKRSMGFLVSVKRMETKGQKRKKTEGVRVCARKSDGVYKRQKINWKVLRQVKGS